MRGGFGELREGELEMIADGRARGGQMVSLA